MYYFTYIRNLESSNSEIESRVVVAMGRRKGSYCLIGTEFFVFISVLEVDGGNGCKWYDCT